MPAPVCCADRLAGVFDDVKMMAMRNIEDRLHLCGAAKGMDSNDGARARCDRSLHALGIDIQVPRFDIDEYRGGALVSNRIRCRNKSERGHDHFIPGSDTKRANAKMQPGGSGADRDSITLTDVSADQLFKLLRLRA